MKKKGERRRLKRVRVAVPVCLAPGEGITRDVSSDGVFFITEQHFSPGMPLRFALELDYAFPGEAVKLHCRGKVLRVETVGERRGVAASISEFWSAA